MGSSHRERIWAKFGYEGESEELGLCLEGIGELKDLGIGKWYDKCSSVQKGQVKGILIT